MNKTAVYIPDPEILAHRICFMGSFSEWMVPLGCSSAIAEISTHPQDALYRAGDHELITRVIKDLEKLRILDSREIVATDGRRVEYGYVVYDLGYEKKMSCIRSYFEAIGLELLGRFAEFEYINSDQAIAKALKLAERLNGRATCFR